MIDTDRASVLRVAELAWNNVGHECQSGPELSFREVIAQAEGVLSERFGISAGAALGLLKRLAEQSDRSVEAVSRRLVRGAHSTLRRLPPDAAHAAQSAARDQDAELRRQLVREATRC